jgi:hypothetical protein
LGGLGVLGWNFINSSAVGYLEKKSDSWFRDWTEKFCVLTNVGLLYYDDPQKRPTNLIPTLDAKVVPVPEATYQRRWVFQIKSLGAQVDLILAARKQDDYEMWLAALEKVQKETEKKKADVMRKQQVRDIGGDKGEGEGQAEVKLGTSQRK